MSTRVSETPREVLSYSLRVRGLYGRKRKPGTGIFEIKIQPVADGPLPDAEVVALCEAELIAQKVKPGASFDVYERLETITVSVYDDGVTLQIRKFALCGGVVRTKGVTP